MTRPLKNQNGTTLVELMVCLVLLALFGTAAVTLVQPGAQAYITVQQLTRAQNLTDALVESVRGELQNADGTISIVNAATSAENKDDIFKNDRLTQGTGLRFTAENNYVEVLDAGYVPKLYSPKNYDADTTQDVFLYTPPDAGNATNPADTDIENYLHMRFYKVDTTAGIVHNKDGNTAKDTAYAYTTAYPNGDYMGLVITNLQFYARGYKQKVLTEPGSDNTPTQHNAVCLTSLTMQVTVGTVTQRDKKGRVVSTQDVYTQTAVIPLPGEPEFK